MAITAEELRILVRAEAKQAQRELDRFRKSAKGTTIDLKSLAKSMIGPLSVTAGIAAITMVAKKGIVSSIKYAAKIEQMAVSFEVLTGSAEVAKSVMEDLREFSVKTPFKFEELGPAAKRLLAFGTEAKNVVDVMRDLGNASAGNSEILNRLVDAYGKVQAKGRASMEELNRFTEAGVPLMRQLATDLGLTNEELFKFVSQGKVGFTEVNTALQNLTRGEGQFAGMLERQSETLEGVLSTLEGAVQDLGLALAQDFLPFLTKTVSEMTRMVNMLGAGKSAHSILETVFGDEFLAMTGEGPLDKLDEAIQKLELAKQARDELNRVLAMERRDISEPRFTWLRSDRRIRKWVEETEAMITQLEGTVGGLQRSLPQTLITKLPTTKTIVEDDEENKKHLAALEKAYKTTIEGQRDAIRQQIEYFQTFKEGPMAVAVLRDLHEELAAIDEIINKRNAGAVRGSGAGLPGILETLSPIAHIGASKAGTFLTDVQLAMLGVAEEMEHITAVADNPAIAGLIFGDPIAIVGASKMGTFLTDLDLALLAVADDLDHIEAVAGNEPLPVLPGSALIPEAARNLNQLHLGFTALDQAYIAVAADGALVTSVLDDQAAAAQKLADEIAIIEQKWSDYRDGMIEMKETAIETVDDLMQGFKEMVANQTLQLFRDLGRAATEMGEGVKDAADAWGDFKVAIMDALPQLMMAIGTALIQSGDPTLTGIGLALIIASGIISFLAGVGEGKRANAERQGALPPEAIGRTGYAHQGDTITIVEGDVYTEDTFDAKTLAAVAKSKGHR